MTELNDIYSTKLLDLAADMPLVERLNQPDASATAHSKLCGSTISVDLQLDGDTVTGFGQTVKACLLGQASASIVAHQIIGATTDEMSEVGTIMREMLKNEGPPPEGRWADLALLEPVRPYKSRHASTLLIFEAIDKAIAARKDDANPGVAAVCA
jgi:NifU-like protein involved in Fe-S cluster formation